MSKIEAAIERARTLRKQAEANRLPGDPRAGATGLDGLARTLPADRMSVDGVPGIPLNLRVAREHRVLSHNVTPSRGQSAYRMLRTRLLQRLRANNWRTLGVSAAGEGEGKSLTAINLAISISAEIGQEALIIDLDLRRPRIHESLGISPQSFRGVNEYLEGSVTDVRDLIFNPGIERLGCILCSRPVERSSDLLASPRGHQLFEELRRCLLPQTVIVVDLPPLLSADDALVVAPMIDAMLLVVAEGQTRRSDVVEAQHLLAEFNVIGTLLNKSVETDPRKYY